MPTPFRMQPPSRRQFLECALGAAAATALPATVLAATGGWPGKLISLTVPYPPGGPSDVLARIVQPGLQQAIGQTVVVMNAAGGGGSIAVQKVLNAAHDGNNLLVGTPMELVMAPMAIPNVQFKAEDLRLAGIMIHTRIILAARKDLPVNNIEELLALARKPGGPVLNYGSVGAGSMYHLLGEKFSAAAKVKMTHVPYTGVAPLVTDLMGSQIDLAFLPLAGSIPGALENGKFKALGIAAAEPHTRFPKVAPISAAAGIGPFDFDLWCGLQVPRNVDTAIVEQVNAKLIAVLKDPKVRKDIEATGSVVAPARSLAELDKLYAEDTARYRAIAQSINLKAA